MRGLLLLTRTTVMLVFGLLALSLSMRVQAETMQAKRLLFVAAAPVQAGKFERLKPIARDAGFSLEYRMIDGVDGNPNLAQLDSFDMIAIDAPYGAALGAVQMGLGSALDGLATPWIWLRRDGSRGNGLPPALIEELDLYYTNGGVANFNGFFCRLDAHLTSKASPCPSPDIHPPAGIYHPQGDGRIFTSLDDYLEWKGVELRTEIPVIGVLFHKAYMDSGLTGFVDDTVRRIEAAGALAVPLYTTAMGNDEITSLLGTSGTPRADVLINMQIMLNGSGRKAEFERLGIPVLQAMPYRGGEQADWEADAVGLRPRTSRSTRPTGVCRAHRPAVRCCNAQGRWRHRAHRSPASSRCRQGDAARAFAAAARPRGANGDHVLQLPAGRNKPWRVVPQCATQSRNVARRLRRARLWRAAAR
jgi:cobaltochelatase CobN